MAYSVLEIAKIIDQRAFEPLPIGGESWRIEARNAMRKRALAKAEQINELVAGNRRRPNDRARTLSVDAIVT